MNKLSKNIIIGMMVAGTLAATSVAMASSQQTSNGTSTNNGQSLNQNIPGLGRGQHKGWDIENKGVVMGKITAINGSTLTISSTQMARPAKNNTAGATASNTTSTTAKTYTVNAASATVKIDNETSTLSKLAVGNQILVKGTASSSDSTQITAQIIHSQSEAFLNRTHYRLIGKITAVSGNTLTVLDDNGTSYTVNSTDAKVTINGTDSTVSKLAVGDTIMVGGFAKEGSTTTITARNIFKGTLKVDKSTLQNAENNGKNGATGRGPGMGKGRGMGLNDDFGMGMGPGIGPMEATENNQ
ncbi:MAG TPA: DUF5666 domain-containing protein [Candidatus Gracilibacteria bacterium]|nr:DUF5666 domain-containing protein [Candidatus Gracilibacteria bacterium]